MSVYDGVCAVVSGGASGIGAALCRELAAQGAKVVVADLNESAARAVARDVGGVAVRCNAAVEMDVRRLISIAEHEVGPIDVFCSNAGIPSNGGYEVPNDEWQRIWGVNVMQHVYVARHLFPKWIARGNGGKLMITASAAGLLTQVGSLPYSVTKHAAVSIAEWLAISHYDDGIRVACLCPQAVRTGMIGESNGDGGVAGGDGVLEPSAVAREALATMAEGKFLILPHKSVAKYFQRKAGDYDRWLKGMRRLHAAYGGMIRDMPPLSAAKL